MIYGVMFVDIKHSQIYKEETKKYNDIIFLNKNACDNIKTSNS